uniref:Putative LAGLIDADG endonuclease n=1 Tax=Ostreobium quekettii TaxID=121088 RepID=A0A650BXA1_9CHLO|nr:putative LAGLIDADG endonuclease [Ostreobium quekettii]QGQ61975.1 putative LAGLIDADG endonuclease [Ostreobium quekettii]
MSAIRALILASLKINHSMPSEDFFTWFLANCRLTFGSFITTRRENLQFVITQKEISVLYMIRDTLGFGRVIQQGQRTYRYIVQDKKALELLVALFNGNLVLPTKQRNFKKFVDLYNQKAGKGRIILEKVNPIQSEILPSLDNGA